MNFGRPGLATGGQFGGNLLSKMLCMAKCCVQGYGYLEDRRPAANVVSGGGGGGHVSCAVDLESQLLWVGQWEGELTCGAL